VASWPGGVSAITLFVEDLAEAKSFYARAFGLPVFFEDSESAVFRFGDTLVNLLDVTATPELIAPAQVGPGDAGHRFQLTVTVEDVDAACAELVGRGVDLLNGPIDRPWGVRTASFQDPVGNIWELAQDL
jgi:catechol 2,3-dioxygenase-like lactoylglutathione lyase family enzyme